MYLRQLKKSYYTKKDEICPVHQFLHENEWTISLSFALELKYDIQIDFLIPCSESKLDLKIFVY